MSKESCARPLLQAGADGSGKTTRDGTPLTIALRHNNREMLEIYLQRKADRT